MSHLYEQLANELKQSIESGLYKAGDKLPGVRELSVARELSIITVLTAYRRLEDLGYIEARARSGHFVSERPLLRKLQLVQTSTESTKPCNLSNQDMILAMAKAVSDIDCVKLGSAVPAPSFYPLSIVQREIQKAAKHLERLGGYEKSVGSNELILQITRRMVSQGHDISADDVVITNGGQEALALALRAVTQPGDLVAVESPTFYGILQVLNMLGLRVIEIPTDPELGISLESLKMAAEDWDLKACVLIPNFNNPQGFLMSDQRKLEVIRLLSSKGITIIEDDTYGDLGYSHRRPSTLLSLSPSSDIIYCNTFSKTLSPDLRIGWVVSGKHKSKIEFLKFSCNIATSAIIQLAVANVLESGKYDRHLRKVRNQHELSVERMINRLSQILPQDCRITIPKGGFVVWVQLPENVDSMRLATVALKKGISIAPGPLFTPSRKYRNFIRLSCAIHWDARIEYALRMLSELIEAHDLNVA